LGGFGGYPFFVHFGRFELTPYPWDFGGKQKRGKQGEKGDDYGPREGPTSGWNCPGNDNGRGWSETEGSQRLGSNISGNSISMSMKLLTGAQRESHRTGCGRKQERGGAGQVTLLSNILGIGCKPQPKKGKKRDFRGKNGHTLNRAS